MEEMDSTSELFLAADIEEKSTEDFEYAKIAVARERLLAQGLENAKHAFVQHYGGEPLEEARMNQALKEKFGKSAPRIRTDTGFASFCVFVPTGEDDERETEYLSSGLFSVRDGETTIRQSCIEALDTRAKDHERHAEKAEAENSLVKILAVNEHTYRALFHIREALKKAPTATADQALAVTVWELKRTLGKLESLGFKMREAELEKEFEKEQ